MPARQASAAYTIDNAADIDNDNVSDGNNLRVAQTPPMSYAPATHAWYYAGNFVVCRQGLGVSCYL